MSFCSVCGRPIENGRTVCEEHSITKDFVAQELRADSVCVNNYSAPVWIIGIFTGLGMLFSTVILKSVISVFNSIFENMDLVFSISLMFFGMIIFFLFSFLGFFVYNNKCKTDNKENMSLAIVNVAFPFLGRTIISGFTSLSSLFYCYGNVSYTADLIISIVVEILPIIIVPVVTCVFLNSVVKQRQVDLASEPEDVMCPINFDDAYISQNAQMYVRSAKSKGVSALLCFFFGEFGIHRFYAGKIGTGLLWMFTAGLFGIGWFVDFIMILVGSFKDSQGKYIK